MSSVVNDAIQTLRCNNDAFFDTTLRSVVDDEGFKKKPYQDKYGVWTFGHGLTWISKEESEIVVRLRLAAIKKQLWDRIKVLSPARQIVLINMAYNLGVEGLLEFHHMWAALEVGNYELAAAEMLDSKWHKKDVGERADELAEIMRAG